MKQEDIELLIKARELIASVQYSLPRGGLVVWHWTKDAEEWLEQVNDKLKDS